MWKKVSPCRAVTFFLLFTVFWQIDSKLRKWYEKYDALFVARCEAKCWKMESRGSCVKSCIAKTTKKPGSCPQNATVFESACIDMCEKDSQCPGLAKCCRHNCGVTCQTPQDLMSAVGLPDIPTDLLVSEGRRKHTVQFSWYATRDTSKFTTLYLVEERQRSGRHYVEKQMSKWTPCFRSVKNTFILKHYLKPGRWYQFRVAAINENGSRGYSEYSLPISPSIRPKAPEAPQNMTVGPLWATNTTINAELRWSEPASDLPLQKYRVFWSKRLHGVRELDSVLGYQQTISKNQNYFQIQNLEPNALYFLQVQALSQFGNQRLQGEKSGLVLNTTNYTNDSVHATNSTHSSTGGGEATGEVKGLRLKRIFWSQLGDLRARITWKSKKDNTRFTVTWWVGPCQESPEATHFKMAATTAEPQFDLCDLEFKCRYRVNVRENSKVGMKSRQDTSISFTTPSCIKFRSSHKKIKC